MKKILLQCLLYLLLVICPFVGIIRVSNYVNSVYDIPIYISIIVGMLSGVAFITGVVIWKNKSSKLHLKTILYVTAICVLVYAGYCTFIFSESNAKSTPIKQEFYNLHPILRLSVGTLTIVDRDLVLTDISRKVKDYDGMGLKRNENSLHFPQSTGYVHAFDIRTNGRGTIRNWVIQGYFWLCGFNTLRHTGTADHLHISIKRKHK